MTRSPLLMMANLLTVPDTKVCPRCRPKYNGYRVVLNSAAIMPMENMWRCSNETERCGVWKA